MNLPIDRVINTAEVTERSQIDAHLKAPSSVHSRISYKDSEYLNKDPKQMFQWFKSQFMVQILEAYERSVMSATTTADAETHIVAFGRLVITKLTEVFPNLKD